jgi:hypothetical protein
VVDSQGTPGRTQRRGVRNRRIRRALLATIGLLYAVSVPWYRSAEPSPQLWWGLPDWVTLALGCYVAIAFLNAGAWLLTEIPEEEEATPPGGGR